MSMLTRCPSCGTSFRITTDQLVSRQGKVRCGRCQQVFSALGSLVHTRETAAHPPSALAPAAHPPPSPAPAPAPQALEEVAEAANSISEPVEELLDVESEGQVTFDTEGPDTEDEEAAAAAPPRISWRRPAAAVAEDEDEDEDDDEEDPPRRRVAWLSLIGVLAATTALTAQAAYFYRDQLSVLEPAAKPWLLKMCAELKCKVQTPADPQAIGIESSGLEADPADKTRIQLIALLRNRSVLEQNLPHLELTLLDARDTPLVRRVFTPEEYAGRGPAPLAPDSEYQVKLTIDAGQIKANGYRLYAFYP